MTARRDKTPYVQQGDQVFIRSGAGSGHGAWAVADARLREEVNKVVMVLRRGSMAFKAAFNRETMHVTRSETPAHKLTRDVPALKTASFRRNAAPDKY